MIARRARAVHSKWMALTAWSTPKSWAAPFGDFHERRGGSIDWRGIDAGARGACKTKHESCTERDYSSHFDLSRSLVPPHSQRIIKTIWHERHLNSRAMPASSPRSKKRRGGTNNHRGGFCPLHSPPPGGGRSIRQRVRSEVADPMADREGVNTSSRLRRASLLFTPPRRAFARFASYGGRRTINRTAEPQSEFQLGQMSN
jgi:hypothetical protein